MRAITLFALVSVAGAVVRWPANASTFEPSACCTIFGGSFSSSAVAYGLDASETTGELYAQGSRFGIEGSISLNPAAKLAVAFWGGGGDVEASVAGALVYFSHVTGALEEVTWNASACTASPFTSESSPSACVGGQARLFSSQRGLESGLNIATAIVGGIFMVTTLLLSAIQ